MHEGNAEIYGEVVSTEEVLSCGEDDAGTRVLDLENALNYS